MWVEKQQMCTMLEFITRMGYHFRRKIGEISPKIGVLSCRVVFKLYLDLRWASTLRPPSTVWNASCQKKRFPVWTPNASTHRTRRKSPDFFLCQPARRVSYRLLANLLRLIASFRSKRFWLTNKGCNETQNAPPAAVIGVKAGPELYL